MLIPNCLFRSNGSAVLLSNRPCDAARAKYSIKHIVRTNLAADDVAFNCVMQTEDAEGKVGRNILVLGSGWADGWVETDCDSSVAPSAPRGTSAAAVLRACSCPTGQGVSRPSTGTQHNPARAWDLQRCSLGSRMNAAPGSWARPGLVAAMS